MSGALNVEGDTLTSLMDLFSWILIMLPQSLCRQSIPTKFLDKVINNSICVCKRECRDFL